MDTNTNNITTTISDGYGSSLEQLLTGFGSQVATRGFTPVLPLTNDMMATVVNNNHHHQFEESNEGLPRRYDYGHD